MSLRWKRSKEQFTETHCGLWKISPKYWGRVTATSYELRRGKGHGEHVGTFDTQSAAKQKADALHSANPRITLPRSVSNPQPFRPTHSANDCNPPKESPKARSISPQELE